MPLGVPFSPSFKDKNRTVGSLLIRSAERKTRAVVLRGGIALGGLAFLAACADTAPAPSGIPAAQEAANYRARARSYYAPPGPPEDPWGPYIVEASQRFDVPEEWIRAVIQQESGGRLYHNGELVTSGPGAMGLMQLMPPTYDEMRAQYSLGDDPYDPHNNIMAGTAYVRQMYDIYGTPGFLAAYNGGPGRLDDFLTHNRGLPRETRRYVASIGRQIAGIYPKNRSQADLMVSSHESGVPVDGTAYASAAVPGSHIGSRASYSTGSASSVRNAWAQRMNGSQPVQMAAAPEDADDDDASTRRAANSQVAFAPQPASDSSSSGIETPDQVSQAWAQRGFSQVAPVPASAGVYNTNTYQPDSYGDADGTYQAPPIAAPTPYSSLTPVYTPYQTHSRKTAYTARQASTGMHVQHASLHKPAQPSSLTFAAAPHRAAQSGSGIWAIQVGAFSSAQLASKAAGSARSRTGVKAVAQTPAVTAHGGRVYRARLTGLSREQAQKACQTLSHCMVIAPGKNL
ncbi:lytic transglycosylase domain-containing protein [Entomobacter blattae]|uniref:Transglycosylase SLT domain protein n=1 Tax=Entomobacter blattae TaxID=2762277 RepID=A0A7H1NQN0_9PROT|nr:lytic transglycosylase domain-containing protein [Entomobacter blattae]QNT78090.1 Transglycosylase SLT domain protein [Entomobacter blattae]